MDINVTYKYEPGTEIVAMGGGLEGAERTKRETALWEPPRSPPDVIINTIKPEADARGRDLSRNMGLIAGAETTRKDLVVGALFRLNAKPNWRYLSTLDKRFNESWAIEFQTFVENWFNLLAESPAKWLDQTRRMTLTSMTRLAVASYFRTGEVVAPVGWIRNKVDPTRPLQTCINIISPDRLSNPPPTLYDTQLLRRGILNDSNGAPQGYFIKDTDPLNYYPGSTDNLTWTYVPARKPWGRTQMIHIYEQKDPAQSRGISDLVAAMVPLRMGKQFSEVVLQNAVVQASYAATLESELPPEMVNILMGGSNGGVPGTGDAFGKAFGPWMNMMAQFYENSRHINIDGAKIPSLPPNTKLNARPLGTGTGGIGNGFEQSFHRQAASALGMSYEEYSRDVSQSNYSSIKAAIAQTGRTMAAQKKIVADSFAGEVYSLAVEEMLNAGMLPWPSGVSTSLFYAPLAKEAVCRAQWISSGRGQIDEMKETQAAILRIKAGLSTYEIECAALGNDFRDIFEQAARENGIKTTLGLTFGLDTSATETDTGQVGGGTDPAEEPPANQKQPAKEPAQ